MAQNAIEMALTLNDKMSAGLGSASERVKQFAEGVAASALTLGGLATIAATVGVALGKAAIDMADAAEQLDNLSASTGVSSKNLQTLQFAFQQGGVDSQALSQGLNFLNRAIAANSPELAKLGVTSKDTFGAFMQAAQGISEVESASERTALMFQVFGRGGAQLTPILNQLASGFGDVADAATRTGSALSEQQLENLRALDTATDKLSASTAGLTNQFVVAFAPAVTTVANALERILAVYNGARDAGKDFGDFIANAMGAPGRGGGASFAGSPDFVRAPQYFSPAGPGNDAGIAAFERATFFGNTLNQTFGTENKLGLRGKDDRGISSFMTLAQEVKPVLDEAGKKFLEFSNTVERAFSTIGDSVANGFYSVLTNLTNKTQTFASAMKAIWRSIVQGILAAMADIVSSAITKAFLKILAIAISSIFGPASGIGVAVSSVGSAAVSPGSIPGNDTAAAFRAGSSGGGGGVTYVIQSINMRDGIRYAQSPMGAGRSANTRIAEIAAVS